MLKSAFLVTCSTGREKVACKELLDLLNRVLCSIEPCVQPARSPINYAVEVENDIRTLVQEKARPVLLKNVRNFVLLESLVAHDVVFLCALVKNLSVAKRYIQNITPLQRLGPLHCILDCISADVSRLNESAGKTYKIVYRQRSSGLVCREVLFETITRCVSLRVDLSCPDYVVVVFVIKNLVGYSVVSCDNATRSAL